MNNFERAAAVLQGQDIADRKPPGYPFDDTDPYKVLEGASYALAVQPDPAQQAYLDKLISLIASAQEPDGYLYTARTIDPQQSSVAIVRRQTLVNIRKKATHCTTPGICSKPLPRITRPPAKITSCMSPRREAEFALPGFWPRR